MGQNNFCWQVSPSPVKLKYLAWAKGHTALDIGSGMGFYAQELQRRGIQVIGVDLFPSSQNRLPLVQASIINLPFTQAFDTVLAFDVLEHIAEEKFALVELKRLTGLRLILSVPNADRTRLTPYNLTYKHHTDKTHQREYMVDELISKLEQAGFEIIAVNKEGPVNPAFFSEFMPGKVFRWLVKNIIKALHHLKILHTADLMADIYVVAEPRK